MEARRWAGGGGRFEAGLVELAATRGKGVWSCRNEKIACPMGDGGGERKRERKKERERG